MSLFDNLSNFQAHFAVAFLACGAVLALLRDWHWAAGAVAALALSLVSILPWYFAGDETQPAGDAKPLRVLAANVLLHNHETDRLLELVNLENPDVVGLAEVDARWMRALEPLRARYPYRIEVPDEGYEGLALYSRWPLARTRSSAAGSLPFPGIAAAMRMPAGDIEFILTHPLPPLDYRLISRRNRQLQALAAHVRDSTLPVVVAGDLNVTMWNPGYRPLAEIAELRNARKGHGLVPTWPAIPALGVPIDHVLATPPIRPLAFRAHAGIGSDHLPVSATLVLDRTGRPSVTSRQP